ncbi:hypothetical protein WJX81_000686 [Elliptochloris bilobata]|uniref:Uncharacterized protein n=1 Tax=Elliptochloris bilobata TaxID=381761 RepID=A0AAW1QWI6_9CHLO
MEPGKQSKVTALDASPEVLRCFWDLAEVTPDARARAALELLEHLDAAQRGFEPAEAPERPAVKGKGAASGKDRLQAAEQSLAGCAPLVAYALKRLARGLASGRGAARQGFALALTGALAALPAVPVAPVLDLLDAALEAPNSMKGGNAKDALLGRVFAYAAVARSGRLSRHGSSAAGTARAAVALVDAMRRKSFLREAAAEALLNMAESLDAAALAQLIEASPEVLELLTAPPADALPEGLLLAVRLWGRLPADLAAQCALLPAGAPPPPADFFTSTAHDGAHAAPGAAAAFFSRAHLQELLPVLRASSAPHPRLHALWPTLLALLLPGYTPARDAGARARQATPKGAPGAGQVEALWGTVAEADLLASSHERKFLAFKLFTRLLPSLTAEHLPALLSPTFLRCLVNALSHADAHLHAAGRRLLDRLVAHVVAAPDPNARVAVAVALVRCSGGGFDRLTGTRTAAQLLQGLDCKGIDAYVQHLQALFLCGAAALPGAAAGVRGGIARWLAAAGLLSLEGAPAGKLKAPELKALAACEPPLALATQQLCAGRLISLVEAAGKAGLQPRANSKNAAKLEGKGAACAAGGGAPADQGVNGAADGAHEYAAARENAQLADVAAFLATAARSKGVQIAGEPAAAAAAAEALRDLLALAARLEGLGSTADVFRSFTEAITPTGVQDLLRVVESDGRASAEDDAVLQAGSNEDSKEEGEDEEDEEEDEEEQEESEEEEAEAGLPAASAAAGSRGKAGANAAEASTSESEGEGADDEAMFRTDAALAAVLRASADAKGASKEAAAALAHFRFRAAALLEAVARRGGAAAAPAAAAAMALGVPTLLRALGKAAGGGGRGGDGGGGGDEAAWAARLQALVNKHVARLRLPEPLPAVEAAELLRKVLHAAARSRDRRVRDAAAAALAAALRWAPAETAQQAVRDVLADYFEKKKDRLSHATVAAVLRQDGAPAAAAPALARYAGDARSEFLRLEAAQLLLGILRPPRDRRAEVAAALRAHLPTLAAGLATLLRGQFAKLERFVAAAGAAANAVSAIARLFPGEALAALLGGPGASTLSAAADEAGTRGPSQKAASELRRLAAMLASAATGSAAGGLVTERDIGFSAEGL